MHLTGDFSVFTLDASSVLTFFQNVTLRLTETTVDASNVGAKGTKSEGIKQVGMIDVSLRSTSTGSGDSVSHYDAGSLTVAGRTFTCYKSAGINISYKKAVRPCVGAKYRSEDNTKLILSGEFDLAPENGDAAAMMTPFDAAAAYTAKNGNWSLAIDGTTYTIPVRIIEAELVGEDADSQMLRVRWEGRSPASGNYPAAPTGTTGLLQKALNAYNTALAFTFQSKASTVGVAVSGNFKFESVSLKIEDEQLIPVQYSLRSDGNWTVAAGT